MASLTRPQHMLDQLARAPISNARYGTLDDQAAAGGGSRRTYTEGKTGQAAEKAAKKGSSGGYYGGYGMEKRSDKVSTANKSILRFPSNLGTDPTQLNYMEFTLKEISAANEAGGGTRGADPRNLVFQKAYGWPTICLPIPSGISQGYQQNWAESQVAGRHAMLAEKGASAINAAGQFIADRAPGGISSPIGSLLEKMKFNPLTAAGSAIGALRDADYGAFAGNVNRTMGNTLSELGAMAVTTNLVEVGDVARAGQYSAGLRIIDQAMLSYGGPGFRAFQYNFSFKPNSEEESGTVYYMVQAFKEFSAPNQRATKYTRVYDLPGVFKIQFFWNGREHPTIGKIGHCALTNINVRYGGDKFTTFHGTHAPVQWDVTLDFKELELLNRDAIATEKWGGSNWPNYAPHHTTTGTDVAILPGSRRGTPE